MSLEKLKLSKPLISAMTAVGYLTPTEVQERCLPRITGGQDLIVIGGEGCGKTTTIVLATLNRIKYGFEEAPRALILVPDRQHVEAIIDCFERLNRNTSIRIIGIHADDPIEQQVNEITDGVDIIIAVPTRARAIYLKLGLNTNKIQLMVIDDGQEMVRLGMQLPINELANSIQKCQHLIFTEVMHDRLSKMIEAFMRMPALIEIEERHEKAVQTHQQLRYHVPNFRTKLNLLNILLSDREMAEKVIVFVNTRLTAQTLAGDLFDGKSEDVFVYKPLFYDDAGFDKLAMFAVDPMARILIVANENFESESLDEIPFIIHFELPEQKETYLERILKRDNEEEKIAIVFSTDLELPAVKKIEQATGQKMELLELPETLYIELGSRKKRLVEEDEPHDEEKAFHQRKDYNAKTVNFGMGQKIKMNKKKKYK